MATRRQEEIQRSAKILSVCFKVGTHDTERAKGRRTVDQTCERGGNPTPLACNRIGRWSRRTPRQKSSGPSPSLGPLQLLFTVTSLGTVLQQGQS
ncbi:hypothetical protein FA95DRAFT_1279455 [Auriscalpium vulgare]|uniref:Uncharacterized protein n=1 Tax=Auriscalpium vulgare TaxID=40419 RepID=A0ACB8RUD2_9AGAM|nr:hypothetical protein FA95DRAFT_1279455 [Auriscalpium vulgare]